MRVLADVGQYDAALTELDSVAAREELDPLLVAVDRGGLLHRAGAWDASSRVWVRAAELADDHERVRLSEEFTGNIPWRMGSLERQTLHTLNALNYLQLGRPEDAAVEARLTNALTLQRHLEERHQIQMERHLHAIHFDEELRPYLVQSAIGLYVSGLAHELAGNEASAFIDYLAAWSITRSAPPGAPSRLTHLEPWLLSEARRLGRPELEALERAIPVPAASAREGESGALVVVVEAGKLPERCVIEDAKEARVWNVCPRPWRRGQARVETASGSWDTETVTSLENILLRRGSLGVSVDTTRKPNLWARAGALSLFVLMPPLGGYLLARSAVEHGTQMEQGWLSLPAEFQVARLSLPPGRHTVRVRRSGQEETREVDIVSGHPRVLVVPMH
ncbi:putative lipoprotein [Myxococcus hansupus]|uniref:Putative lipoprotein n=2 Tax=Pseudomyxococcus hansupus TaxID=1297742 RepID=A0A0H4WXK5_9BACT|nr:putative lipoprotein [Myxococcus hansupus]